MMSSVLPHAHTWTRSTSESWPGLCLSVPVSCFPFWLLSGFNCTSLASRPFNYFILPSILCPCFLPPFPLFSRGCPLETVQWPVLSRLRGFSPILSIQVEEREWDNSRQGCVLGSVSSLVVMAHITPNRAWNLCCAHALLSIQHTLDIMLSGIIITITFCTLRALQTGWGVP